MEVSLLLSLTIFFLLQYAGAWISSSETALFSLSSHKIKTFETDLDPKKRLIAELLAHPRDLLVTVFMINTCINILLQNVASDMVGKEAGWGLKVGVPLILTLIFGEIIPKYIGLQNNVRIATKVAPTLQKIQNNLAWLRKTIILLTTPVSRVMFFFLKKEESISKSEIEHVLKTSEAHGVLNRAESELLVGFLDLQDSQVKELMWPKEDIIFYEISQPLSKLVSLMADEACTRIPVCQDSIENVLGIMTSMEYFKHQKLIKAPQDLLPLLQKPFFVPESIAPRLLLKRMDEASHILAFVVDEYGTIEGLISREDLTEVVVGQIEDEKDQPPLFIQAGKNEVIASGKWELSEFNDHFHVDFESPNNMVTIGGWLSEQLGDIPSSGSKHEFKGFHFQVLASSPTRITRLFIKKLPTGPK